MFCLKCGQPLEDGSKFCPFCGENLAADVPEQPVTEVQPEVIPEQPVAEVQPEVIPEQPVAEVPLAEVAAAPVVEEAPVVPKKKSKKPLIITLVSLVSAAAVACVFIFTPLKNVFVNMFYSPEARMEYVYTTAAQDTTKGIGEVWDAMFKGDSAGVSSSGTTTGTMEIEVSDAILSLLAQNAGMDLSFLDKVSIDYKVAVQDAEKLGYDLCLKLNGTEIATIKLYMDMNSGEMVMDIPGILSQPIKTSIMPSYGEDMDDYYGSGAVVAPSVGGYSMLAMLEEMNFDSLPTGSEMETLLNEIIAAAVGALEDVEKSEEEFTAGGVTQKTTCLEVDIGLEDIAKMANAVLDVVKENKTVEKAVIGFCDDNAELLFGQNTNVDGEEIYDNLLDAIDELQDQLEDVDGVGEEITVKTYVNYWNEIVAFELEAEGQSLFIGTATDGDKVGYEISFDDMFYFGGEGTKKGDLISGEYELTVENENVLTLKVENFDTKKLDEGILNGTFHLIPGDMLVQQVPELGMGSLKLTFGGDGKTGSLTAEVLVSGVSAVTIRMNVSATEGATVTIPDGVDAESITPDMLNLQTIIDRLKAAGVPQNLLDMLEGSMNPSSGYDDYYGDYDDYYGDYDENYDDYYGYDYAA